MRGPTFIEHTYAVLDAFEITHPSDPARDLDIARSLLRSMKHYEQDLAGRFDRLREELLTLRRDIRAAEAGIEDAQARLPQ